MTPENPFAAHDVGVLYTRGRPFHHPRSLARIRAIVGDAPLTRALDVACGTGMSTTALAEHAPLAVGIDVSPEMLRAARPARGAAFMLASAERLPFADRSLDAVTCCSGVHWFDQQRFFSELRRVLRRDGWVGLYDHYFLGEMVDVPAFAEWTRAELDRYPLPDRNPQVGDPRAATPDGFEKIGDEFFGDDIEMTHDSFADYQLTISNFVAAAERGTPPRGAARRGCSNRLHPCSRARPRVLRFLGSITCLRPTEKPS